MTYVQSGMTVGLGTGSTADFFLVALGAAIKAGSLANIRGVPTSRQSENRAREVGIPLATLAECPKPDVTIDGADEVAPNLDLIKGLGGALLREKVVAQNSVRLIIIADASKTVSHLGSKSMLPVEVAQFGHEIHVPFFRSLGARPELRLTPAGSPFITDNGNFIYDLRFPSGIADADALQEELKKRAGVVETGLFLHIASIAIIADQDKIEILQSAG